MKIRCSNTGCESHLNQGMFTLNVVCDDERSLAETLISIPSEYFECIECGSKAELAKKEPTHKHHRTA